MVLGVAGTRLVLRTKTKGTKMTRLFGSNPFTGNPYVMRDSALEESMRAVAAWERFTDDWDREYPEWEQSEGYGERYLSEGDFPIYDRSADDALVSDDDWNAYAEMTFSEFPRV